MAMAPMWFLYSDNTVNGPFSTEQVRDRVQAGLLAAGTYIWWKGSREWLPIEVWDAQVDQILLTATSNPNKAIWYVNVDGSAKGPLTESELTQMLRPMAQMSKVRLWCAGMAKWTGIYEVDEALELLGISRRENDRAPLMGQAIVSRSNDDPKAFMLKTATISIAGMGLTGHHDLRTGDSISLTIKSQELASAQPLNLRGKVVYVAANGYVGVVFANVHAELVGTIIDYTKRFAQNSASRAA